MQALSILCSTSVGLVMCLCLSLRALAGFCRLLHLTFCFFWNARDGQARFMLKFWIVQSGRIGGTGRGSHGDELAFEAVELRHRGARLSVLASRLKGEQAIRARILRSFLDVRTVRPRASRTEDPRHPLLLFGVRLHR